MNIQPKKWTEEEKEMCIRLKRSGLSHSEIGEHLDRSKSSVGNFLWELKQSTSIDLDCTNSCGGDMDAVPQPAAPMASRKNPTVTGTEEEIIAEACTEDIRTLEDLLKVCNIDTEKWQVKRWAANTWPAYTKVGEEIVTKNLYQVKAQLEAKPISQTNLAEIFAACAAPHVKYQQRFEKDSGTKLMEISIPDLHLGKLSWGDETGHANYDTNEAILRFKDAVEDFLSREKACDIDEILLPLGNDLLNVDSKNNETSNGTPQTEDGRWQKSFKKACELTTWAVNRCLEIAPTKVIIVPGNHDTERSYYLGCFLEAQFSKTEGAVIYNCPTERKYVKFGNTLIGFTHGDRIKLKDLINLAQTEQRKAWGSSKYCEWHLGHLHRESTFEEGGVIARVIPSLCPPDAWHSKHGYVMSIPAAQAFVYDAEMGLEQIHYHRVR
jgi:predicted phosphodiesterase